MSDETSTQKGLEDKVLKVPKQLHSVHSGRRSSRSSIKFKPRKGKDTKYQLFPTLCQTFKIHRDLVMEIMQSEIDQVVSNSLEQLKKECISCIDNHLKLSLSKSCAL